MSLGLPSSPLHRNLLPTDSDKYMPVKILYIQYRLLTYNKFTELTGKTLTDKIKIPVLITESYSCTSSC